MKSVLDGDAYFYKLVIAALSPDEDMSMPLRVWCLCVGIPGTIVADPVMFICNKLGVSGGNSDDDPFDPTSPLNQNY